MGATGGRALQNPLAPLVLAGAVDKGPSTSPHHPCCPSKANPATAWEQQDPHNSRADVPKSRGQCPDNGADGCPTLACFPTGRKVPKLGVGSNCAGPGAGLLDSLEGTVGMGGGVPSRGNSR